MTCRNGIQLALDTLGRMLVARTVAVVVIQCGASALAQAPDLDVLFDRDWRARNRGASALAASATIDIERLLAIAEGKAPGAYAVEYVPDGPWFTYVGIGEDPELLCQVLDTPGELVATNTSSGVGAELRLPENFWVPWPTRVLAFWLLGTRREGGARALQVCMEALANRHQRQVQRQAAWAFVQLGEIDLPRVREALRDEQIAGLIARELCSRGDAGCTELASHLDGDDDVARATALQYLPRGWLREHLAIIERIALLFLHGDGDLARHAGTALRELRDAALPPLRDALRSDHPRARQRAVAIALLLEQAVSERDRAQLAAAARTDDRLVQLAAVRSLDRLEALGEVPLAVVRGLIEQPWLVRPRNLRMLAAHGTAGMPDLAYWLRRDDEFDDKWQRTAALDACERLGSGTRPELERWLESREPRLRAAAVRGMSAFRTDRDEALDDVRRTLADRSAAVRAEAVRWLDRLEPGNDADLDTLLAALVEFHADVRGAAARTLGARGLSAAFVDGTLVPLLANTRFPRRAELIGLLEKGPVADTAVTAALIAIVREDPDDDAAVRALGRIGAVTDESRATLQDAYDRLIDDARGPVLRALHDLHRRR